MGKTKLTTPEGEEFEIVLVPVPDDEDHVHFLVMDEGEPIPKKVSTEYFSKCTLKTESND